MKSKNLRKQLLTVIGKEALDKMLHVYYRTNCFAENKGPADVEKHFVIPFQLGCSCGATRETCHVHTHILGTWTGVNESNKHRSLHVNFTDEKAYACKSIGNYSSLNDKISCIKHFINTACYIQTKRGWHKKTEQRNKNTFASLEENKAFLSEMYREWLWAQVTYMRYLSKKMDDIHRKLDFAIEIERTEHLEHKLLVLDNKQKELERTWGEAHLYSDEEIANDLAKFIEQCKEFGNSETA